MDVDAGDLPVKPNFTALSAQEQNQNKVEFRRVSMRPLAGSSSGTTSSSSMCSTSTSLVQSMGASSTAATTAGAHTAPHAHMQVTVPQHRMTPLKNAWMQLYTPITEQLKLDMRMNLKTKKVG